MRALRHDGASAVPAQVPRELPTGAPAVGAVRSPAPAGLVPGSVHRVAGVQLDGLTVGTHHVAAASVVGDARAAAGVARQDAYDVALDPCGRIVVAVADGTGARPHSHLGARMFCEQVTFLAQERPGLGAENLLRAAAAAVGASVHARYGLPPAAVRFTAAVAVVDGTGRDLARVGGVTAFALTPGGPRELFGGTGPVCEPGAYLPAPGDDSLDVPVETASSTGPGTLAVVTDGLALDLRRSAPVRAWLETAWAHPVGPWAMGDSLRYRCERSTDDRTAVLVWYDRSATRTEAVPPRENG